MILLVLCDCRNCYLSSYAIRTPDHNIALLRNRARDNLGTYLNVFQCSAVRQRAICLLLKVNLVSEDAGS